MIADIKKEFPILKTTTASKSPLIYLDNAATTLTPLRVSERVKKYYDTQSANIHRGVHYLSQQATEDYEAVREKVKNFINAEKSKEIIFTAGTTDSINLIANSLAPSLEDGDEIVVSQMEHHSNIVPWQLLVERLAPNKKIHLKVIPMNQRGELELTELPKLLSAKTKLVGIVYCSNSLGTINDIPQIIKLVHDFTGTSQQIPILVDAAQMIAHHPIDVQKLGVDFLVFSAHKMFGPTGSGILYGKEKRLKALPPYRGGGDMILNVSFSGTTYNDLPYKFEAGTPHIAGVIGLGAAIDFILDIGFDFITNHEKKLLDLVTAELEKVKGLQIRGEARKKAAICSFTIGDIHPHDIGSLLDEDGIAVRVGHHCTQPVMEFYQIPATTRAAFSIYNTEDEILSLSESLQKVQSIFQ